MEKIWLSHVLSADTPMYGHQNKISINSCSSISGGDTCNSGAINLPFHSGTHIDAPNHFIDNGKAVDSFSPDFWVFDHPSIMEVSAAPGHLIGIEDIKPFNAFSQKNEIDILIIRSGFETYRNKNIYSLNGPGLAAELVDFIKINCPNVRVVGMDFISVSSFSNRQAGRKAHKAFLEKDILLLEDMKLSSIKPLDKLRKIIAMPIRIKGADGAPCTIIGYIDREKNE